MQQMSAAAVARSWLFTSGAAKVLEYVHVPLFQAAIKLGSRQEELKYGSGSA